MSLVRRAIDGWFRPIDPSRLDLFTRVFALTLLVYLGHRLLHPYEWLTREGFHSGLFHQRLFGRTLPLLMPEWAVPFFAFLICGCVLAVIVGWRSQLMCRLLVPQLIYIQLVDSYSTFTMNKLYIVVFAILAVAPEPTKVAGTWQQSAWVQRTLQLTLVIFYFNAGLAKALHGDWLYNYDVLWSQAQGMYRTDLAAWMLRNLPKWTWSVLQNGSLVFELTAPVLFSIKRTRPLAIFVGSAFHLGIAATMYMLILFSAQVMTFYTLFFSDDFAHSIARRLGMRRYARPDSAT